METILEPLFVIVPMLIDFGFDFRANSSFSISSVEKFNKLLSLAGDKMKNLNLRIENCYCCQKALSQQSLSLGRVINSPNLTSLQSLRLKIEISKDYGGLEGLFNSLNGIRYF